MAEINIPRLDLNDFLGGTPQQKKKFSDDLGKAFTETGFITIANHGLPPALLTELYAEVKKFFDLPDDVKGKYEDPALAGQRGYTSKGKEKAKDSKTADLKEFWQRGQTVTNGDKVQVEYPENMIVEELPRFNEVTKEVFEKLDLAGKNLMSAISLFLGLDENYFADKIHNGNSILRGIHYFPIADPDSLPLGAVRAGAHEDINLITLLIGASADGLEVLTVNGDWYPVKAQGEDIVVNVGDMLQRLTNNRLKSTTHRVVNPPKEFMKNSRYSVPFFLHPKSSVALTCLDSCIDEQHPKAYPDITAGEYLDERLKEIGLKM